MDSIISFSPPTSVPSSKGQSTGITSTSQRLAQLFLPHPGSVFLCGHSAPVESRVAQSRDLNVSNVIQVHLLLPPPPPWHRTALLVCPLAFSVDGASNHILCNCLPLHVDIVSDRVHTTLLQHFIGEWVYPLAIHPSVWRVFLCHPVCGADVESFESGYDSWAQDPRLASVQEDRLHNGLVKFGAQPRRQVLLL
jgi:hypothetical protein